MIRRMLSFLAYGVLPIFPRLMLSSDYTRDPVVSDFSQAGNPPLFFVLVLQNRVRIFGAAVVRVPAVLYLLFQFVLTDHLVVRIF